MAQQQAEQRNRAGVDSESERDADYNDLPVSLFAGYAERCTFGRCGEDTGVFCRERVIEEAVGGDWESRG
jgi:hypothetical protein